MDIYSHSLQHSKRLLVVDEGKVQLKSSETDTLKSLGRVHRVRCK